MTSGHRPGIRLSLIGLAGGVLTGLAFLGTAWAQVPNVTIGTNPAGTVFYAVGSGLAKVASESGSRSSWRPGRSR
jgi:hypothetical protein